MDYDDDDITRRNLQLAGESRTRSSPVLRPYDFPKFDFDDNLQGHLRFDSLVETEVFLGIQSQEDNNWIEDFSQVSNGMEFNPNPVDSCSISRRDNVWSEATSSESVEMLLKSVGQEELTPVASIMPGTNASDDLGTLTRRVEPGREVDERSNFCVADVDVKSKQDELKNLAEPEVCMEEKLSKIEGPALTPKNVGSSREESCTLTEHVLCGIDGMPTMDGTHSSHNKPSDENLEEQETSVEKNNNCEAAVDSVCLPDISHSEFSLIATLSTSGALQQVGSSVQDGSCNEDSQELLVSTGKELGSAVSEVNTGDTSIAISTLCSTPSSVTEPGVVSQDADGAHLDCAKGSINISVKGKPEVKFSGGDNKDASLGTFHTDVDEAKDADMSSEMKGPTSLDVRSAHSAELGSFHIGQSSSLGQKTDSSAQLTGGHDFGNIENVLTNQNHRKIVPDTNLFSMDINVQDGSCDKDSREIHVSTGKELGSAVSEVDTSIAISTLRITPCSVTEPGAVSQDADGSHLDCAKGSTNISVEGKPEVKFSEGDDKNASLETVQTAVDEAKDGGVSTEMEDPSSLDVPRPNSVELGSFHTGQSSSLVPKTDSSAQLTGGHDFGYIENALTNQNQGKVVPETTLFSMEISVEKSSSAALLSPNAENEQTEMVETCRNEAVREEPGADLPGHFKVASGQVVEENLSDIQADLSAKKQLSGEINEEDTGLSGRDVNSKEAGTLICDQMTQSLGAIEGVKSNENLKLQNHTSEEMDSVNDVAAHAKRNTSVGVGLDNGTENEQRISDVVGLCHSDVHQNDAEWKSSNQHPTTEVGGLSEVEVGVADDSARSPPCEVAAKSHQSLEELTNGSSSRSKSRETNNSLHLDNPIVHLGCEKSTLKGTNDADVGVGDNAEVAIVKSEESQEVAQATEVDKASCGSPTIISSSEPSQIDKDDGEESKGSGVIEMSVRDCQPTSKDTIGKDVSADDSSFTFKVNALPDTASEPVKSWSPFPDVGKCNPLNVVKGSTPSAQGKMKMTSLPDSTRQSDLMTDVEHSHGTPQGTSERKGRRASGKRTTKESSKKGSRAKHANQEGLTGKMEKGSDVLLNTPNRSSLAQYKQSPTYKNMESSNTKLGVAPTVPMLNRPDSNASTRNKSNSSSSLFRQPFSDLQQIQLRAQIFVYGSLIQGMAPEEHCMVSAFGPSERTTWEPVWRSAVERLRIQKSSSGAAETPLHSRSGARVSDAAAKQSSHSTKLLTATTPSSKAGSKHTSATTGNPMIPLSSPLWSISTPSFDKLPSSTMHKTPVVDFHSTVTPLHSYQTPPVRSFVAHTNWPSQSCFPSPWSASPQTATFSSSVRFEPVTMTETVKLTPAKDTTLQSASGMKHLTSSAAANNVGPSPVYRGPTSLSESKMISSPELLSGDSRPRKIKKVPTSDPVQVSSVSGGQMAPVLIPNFASLQALPVDLPASISTPPSAVLSKPVAAGSTDISLDRSKDSELESGKTISCSEETLTNVREAKTQAEDAANLATAAVSHCEDLWAKLADQKEAGLTSEAEANLVSAAAAISAAASVAKAAAAAAKIARDAALQAKLMADEAFFSDKSGDMVPSSGKSIKHNSGIVNGAPASILKGGKLSTKSSTTLVAAKEAAKRRVEAASAASKQAENLHAIVKAAELAAAAVSQAGKLVSMGEPLPLNDLIEAGPEGFWKLPESPAKIAGKLGDGTKEQSCVAVSKEGAKEQSKDSMAAPIVGPMQTDNLEFRTGTDGKSSETDITKTIYSDQNEHVGLAGTLPEDSIKEGSLVEVFKCGDGLKSAWYSANVLGLEGGKAYVCYSDLSADKGSESLREWVPLEGEGDKAPIIRLAQPMTVGQYQGTRKRRRATLGDYAWSVEDRVDVWIDDCWWEGVVTEKNEKDETTLKVHFPAQGETLTVRAWNMRTSRSWIDGKWVEWAPLKAHSTSEQSDTPQEKRQKLGSPLGVTVKETNKLPNDSDLAFGKSEASKFLSLSTSERTFDIGKTTKDDNKRAARRPLKAGQQKEGSRVVFGVPKPTGKKRKFMEVSKKFPANKGGKINEVSDPVKSSKYLMPQGTGSQGWKASSRNDSKEKRTVEPKPRVPNTRRAYRTLAQKDNLRSRLGQDREDNGTDPGSDVEDSVCHDDNTSEKMVDHDYGASDEPAEAPLSSLLQHTFASSKKTSSSNSRSERLTRGKLEPSGGKLSKIEEDRVYRANSSKVVSDISEPRRSNRRINPTHRLLEGLQTSMMIPKMPPVSYDKAHKNQSKNVFTRHR